MQRFNCFEISLARLVLTAAVLLGSSLTSNAATSATPTFTRLYVFGDSYSDVGNMFIATAGAEPAAPYFNGRFSNGSIWVDHIAGFLGLGQLKPYLGGGTDFAFGGAEVTAPITNAIGTVPSVPQQVGIYLQSVGGKADPNALYIIQGGSNDILNATSGSAQQLGFQIALGISDSELLLRRAGARHFLIPNLFNVGLLPAASAKVAFATAATNATNTSLNSLLAIESLLENIRIIRLDVFGLENAIVTDPLHFGFTDITDPCLTTTVCPDPDHTFFWDVEHPGAFAHSFFAVAAQNSLATTTW